MRSHSPDASSSEKLRRPSPSFGLSSEITFALPFVSKDFEWNKNLADLVSEVNPLGFLHCTTQWMGDKKLAVLQLEETMLTNALEDFQWNWSMKEFWSFTLFNGHELISQRFARNCQFRGVWTKVLTVWTKVGAVPLGMNVPKIKCESHRRKKSTI